MRNTSRERSRPVASCDPRHGFTLIEVFIAFAILAVGILAMTGAQIQAMRGGQTGRHLTQASVIARDRIEALHRLDWADAQLADTTASPGPPAGYTAPVPQNNTVQGVVVFVEQTYNVQNRVIDLAANLKGISVRVSWAEPNGRNRSHVISSVRHDDP